MYFYENFTDTSINIDYHPCNHFPLLHAKTNFFFVLWNNNTSNYIKYQFHTKRNKIASNCIWTKLKYSLGISKKQENCSSILFKYHACWNIYTNVHVWCILYSPLLIIIIYSFSSFIFSCCCVCCCLHTVTHNTHNTHAIHEQFAYVCNLVGSGLVVILFLCMCNEQSNIFASHEVSKFCLYH